MKCRFKNLFLTTFFWLLLGSISSGTTSQPKACSDTFKATSQEEQLSQNVIQEELFKYKSLKFRQTQLRTLQANNSSLVSVESLSMIEGEIQTRLTALLKAGVTQQELQISSEDIKRIISKNAPDTSTEESQQETRQVETITDEIKSREPVAILDGKNHGFAWVSFLKFSPDKKIIAVGNYGVVALWDVATRTHLRDLKIEWVVDNKNPPYTAPIGFSPDGKTAVVASFNGKVTYFDISTGQILSTFLGHNNLKSKKIYPVRAAQILKDGKRVISASNNMVFIWDLETQEIKERFKVSVSELAVSPDEETFVTGDYSGKNILVVRSMKTGRIVKKLVGHPWGIKSIEYSPDGKTLLSSSEDGTARIWDLKTGKEILVFTGHYNPDPKKGVGTDWVTSAVFFKNATMVATTSRDGTTKFWDAKTGEVIDNVGFGVDPEPVLVSEDGVTSYIGAMDGNVRIFSQVQLLP